MFVFLFRSVLLVVFPKSALQGVSVRCVGGERHDQRPAPISARLQSAVQQPIKDRRGSLFRSSLCSLWLSFVWCALEKDTVCETFVLCIVTVAQNLLHFSFCIVFLLLLVTRTGGGFGQGKLPMGLHRITQ